MTSKELTTRHLMSDKTISDLVLTAAYLLVTHRTRLVPVVDIADPQQQLRCFNAQSETAGSWWSPST